MTTSFAIDSDDSHHIEMMSFAVYMSSDIILSTVTTILFFRPLYLHRNESPLINQQANDDTMASSAPLDLLTKYGMISGLQLIVTVFVDILNVVENLMVDKVI